MFEGKRKLPSLPEKEGAPSELRKWLSEFMRDPAGNMTAALASIVASGRSELIFATGRIVQAAYKKRLIEQVVEEIQVLVNNGKLNEDYAESPLGYQSLLELIEFIDSEAPDEDRLRAMKAMFVGVNTKGAAEHRQALMYQLMKLSRKLSGSQIRLLAAIYDASRSGHYPVSGITAATSWLTDMASRLGHGLSSLIELDEESLLKNKLITPRTHADASGIDTQNARLTDLGLKFCEALKNYDRLGDEPKEK